MVPGNDLCDILGLFFDLAESMEVKNNKKLDALEKYKIAYNNKVRREKREKEKNIEDNDPRFKTLREANTKLAQEREEIQKELDEVKENLELLLIDNDEKEKNIKELLTDLNIKTSQAESMMKGL